MYKTINEVTLASLKQHCTKIHYFGLGFIQIKLGPHYRIHFYTEQLPAIISEEEIHNHRYDFTSTILAGTFTQKIYQVIPGATHTIEDESCSEHENQTNGHASQVLEPQLCSVTLLSTETYVAGSTYTITADTYHTVHTSDAITVLDRKPYSKEFAQVIRPNHHSTTCPFSKKISEDELWGMVEKILVIYQSP